MNVTQKCTIFENVVNYICSRARYVIKACTFTLKRRGLMRHGIDLRYVTEKMPPFILVYAYETSC